MANKENKGLLGLGILTAVASSLCCITPVLAMLAGSSGMASSFSWIEPARPYLIASTFLVLGLAWWLKLRPVKTDDCGCEVPQKSSFFQSKKFLLIVTILALVMTAFPYYSHIFYSSNQTIEVADENLERTTIMIEGMTCDACQKHVDHAILELKGISSVETSYELGQTTVKFDKSQTTHKDIVAAINSTGYNAVE